MVKAMFSHVRNGEWDELPLDEVLAMVEGGKARECFECEYDDDLRSFHCVEPCGKCDLEEA